jgi:hypothetical protein
VCAECVCPLVWMAGVSPCKEKWKKETMYVIKCQGKESYLRLFSPDGAVAPHAKGRVDLPTLGKSESWSQG